MGNRTGSNFGGSSRVYGKSATVVSRLFWRLSCWGVWRGLSYPKNFCRKGIALVSLFCAHYRIGRLPTSRADGIGSSPFLTMTVRLPLFPYRREETPKMYSGRGALGLGRELGSPSRNNFGDSSHCHGKNRRNSTLGLCCEGLGPHRGPAPLPSGRASEVHFRRFFPSVREKR